MEQQKARGQGMKVSGSVSELKNSSSMFVLLLLLLLTCSLSACASGSSANASVDSQGQVTVTSRQTPAASSVKSQPTSANQVAANAHTTTNYPVNVYFSRIPQSMNDSSAVFPVERLSPTSSVSTFALDQLMSGPTAAESASGYVSEIKSHLTGPSVCPPSATNADFILSLNTKGTISEAGTATLKFCRLVTSAGIGTDARAIAEINATLKQFPAIKKVIILTKDAHCFGDESGADMCMR